MFKIFKNSRIVIPLILVGMTAGAIQAHRTSGGRALPSLSTRGKQPTPEPVEDPWRSQLSLAAAKAQGNQLVQRLEDGSKVSFTLQPALQRYATGLLEKYELPYGGIVVTDVKTGKVRVLAGRSGADPKVGVEEMCLTPWAPAASIFKLVTAAALLDSGVPPNAQVCYHGGLRGLRAHHLEDNPARDTTCNTLTGAVAKSINPIMGKLALRYLDRRSQKRWAERFGFNQPIRFDLPVRRSRAKIPADRVERARVAAGFWHTELSPLHAALIAQTIAAGGELLWPRLVEQVRLASGRVVRPVARSGGRVLGRDAARKMARMMRQTTVTGTGRRGFRKRSGRPYLAVDVAGKTGSLSRKDPFLSYSWFVGFAPVDKPEVAFAVLLGNPPKWRIKASTAARLVLAEHLRLKRKQERQRKQQLLKDKKSSQRPPQLAAR